MTFENDPIFDALAEEALGRRQPPDLSARILKAWAEAKSTTGSSAAEPSKLNGHALNGQSAKFGLPHLIHLGDTASPLAPPMQACGKLSSSVSANLARRRKHSTAVAIVLAASVVGVGLMVGLLANGWGWPSPGSMRPIAAKAAPPSKMAEKIAVKAASPARQFAGSSHVPSGPVPSGPVPSDAVPNNSELRPSELVANTSALPSGTEPQNGNAPPVETAPRTQRSEAEVVASINNELNRLWVAAAVKPTPAVSDEQWCQRVFSSLLGRAARPAEVKRCNDDVAQQGREAVLDRLLTSQRYKQEFTEHWASNWTTQLLGPRENLAGPLASRSELQKYLAAALLAEKPADKIVRELLTATGSTLPEAADYNPAVNFLLDRWDASGIQATGRVARILLGHDLQCAQCHQHPTEGWSQEQFWSFNAFFRQMRVERSSGTPRVVNVDFPGQHRGSRDGEVFFETPTGLMKSAFPRFLDGTQTATSGMLKDVDRRAELARLVTQSHDFARTLVNDVWKQLLGYGLESTGDNDSRGLDASLLDPLAEEFAASGYDVQALIRWIVLSEPFGRAAQITDLATKDVPEAGEPALFTRFYERRPSPGDATRLLLAASRIRTTQAGASARLQAQRRWLVQANQTAVGGKQKNVSEKTATSEILAEPAAPAGLNSPVRDRALMTKLLASQMPFDKKVEHLFLAATGRLPLPRETRTAAELLKASGDDQAGVLEDVWWSLVNSSECVLER
jgi:hypothetical protein